MKHKIPLFILFLLLFTPALYAYDFQYGDLYYYITDRTACTVEVTCEKYSDYNENYSGLTKAIIPETVEYNGNTYSVTSIGGRAFYYSYDLTEVVVPNSVTSIGGYAFYGCRQLTSITIPESVTRIEDDAFSGNGLTEISVAEGNTHYDSRNNCNAIIETKTNTLIAGCRTTTIPDGVTRIGSYAFYGSNVYAITIPESVTSIGNHAFDECYSLSITSLPLTPPTLGSEPFGRYATLYVVYENMDVYKNSDWKGQVDNIQPLSNVVSDVLCYTVTDHVARTVTVRQDDSYPTLTQVTVPTTVTSWWGTTYTVTSIAGSAFSGCSGLTSITIPEGITSIGERVFYGCSSLTEIVIPSSVTSIAPGAFSGSHGLTEIRVAEGNTTFDSRDNCNAIIETATNTLIAGCQTTIIPDGILSIGDRAFYDCTGLTEITIPNSVTSIGYRAFEGCSGLKEITIPNSVTSIGDCVFYGCSGLTEIVIPESVTSIGGYAFYGCTGLTKAMIGNGVTAIEEETFSGCSSLTEVTIGAGVTSIGERAFYDCRRLQSVTSLATTPPAINVENEYYGTFGNIPRYTILYVYEQYLEDYKFSDWSLFFGYLRPIDEKTGLEDVYGEGGGAAEGDRAADGADNGAPRKVMRDGQLLIIHGEETYTATGVRMK